MAKTKNNQGIFFVILIVLGILIFSNMQKKETEQIVPSPADTNINIYNPPVTEPTPSPVVTDKTLPTSLMASISPLVINMNEYANGQVTSNGRNFAITTQANFITGSQTTEVPGFIDSDGIWELWQQVNSPGFWQFQTTSENGITSNIVNLEVRGMMIRTDKTSISRLRKNNDVIFTVYSNHRTSNINIFMYPGGDLTRPVLLGTGRTNKDGFYQTTILVPMTTLGNYMVDVEYGRTDSAHLYTFGTTWINLMR